AVPGHPAGLHRAAVQQRVLGQQGARHLRGRRVRRAAVRLRQQVRQPHRLAELHGADRAGQRGREAGPQPRHGPDRGPVRPRRQPSRPGVPGRARRRGRAALLHQLRRPALRPARRPGTRGLRRLPQAVRAHRRHKERMTMSGKSEKAILAGGCFWGMQDLIRKRPGVISTRVGYTGGDVPNATYRHHGTHAEAIEITFDPEQISYRDVLDFFCQIPAPPTLNRQGNDIGTSYRSAIFYTSDAQKRVAEDTIADVDASGLWPGKVVTEVPPAGPFWEAEPEHQDYLENYPYGYTC